MIFWEEGHCLQICIRSATSRQQNKVTPQSYVLYFLVAPSHEFLGYALGDTVWEDRKYFMLSIEVSKLSFRRAYHPSLRAVLYSSFLSPCSCSCAGRRSLRPLYCIMHSSRHWTTGHLHLTGQIILFILVRVLK